MVFQGRLSTGCTTCRRRKIKCDEAQPGCRRCFVHGTQCPGYSDAYSFRPQNAKLERQGQARKIGKKNKNREVADGKLPRAVSKNAPAVSTEGSNQPQLVLPISLCPPRDQQSVCYFIDQHLLPADNSPSGGHLAFIPEFYRESADDTCLNSAILSVSYLTLFNRSQLKECLIAARKHYGIALASLNAALNSVESASRDECLCAALLLSMFIDLSGERNGISNPHAPGVYFLVQLRGKRQFSSKYGLPLFGWAFTQLQAQFLANREYSYGCLGDFVNTLHEPHNAYRGAAVVCKLASFCQQADKACEITCQIPPDASNKSTETHKSLLRTVVGKACHLLLEIDNLDEIVPQSWKPSYLGNYPYSSSPSDCSSEVQLPEPDQWTACFLALYRSALVIFYLKVFHCYEKLNSLSLSSPAADCHLETQDQGKPLPTNALALLESRITCLISEIYSTVEVTLGRVNESSGDFELLENTKLAHGYILLWPLWAMVNCPFSTALQVSFSQNALRCIGSVMGCRLALDLSRRQYSSCGG